MKFQKILMTGSRDTEKNFENTPKIRLCHFCLLMVNQTLCKTRQVYNETQVVKFIPAILSVYQYTLGKYLFWLKKYLDKNFGQIKTSKHWTPGTQIYHSDLESQSILLVKKHFGQKHFFGYKTFFGKKNIWVDQFLI